MLSIVVGKPSDTVEQRESPPKETATPTPVVAKARYDSKCLFITMLYKVVLTFKGQMNQNLNIFSLAILKRRNVKQNIQKETYAEIFLYEP